MDLLGLYVSAVKAVKGPEGLGWRLVEEHPSSFSGSLSLTGGMRGGREPAGRFRTLVGFVVCGTKRAWNLLINKWIHLEGKLVSPAAALGLIITHGICGSSRAHES